MSVHQVVGLSGYWYFEVSEYWVYSVYYRCPVLAIHLLTDYRISAATAPSSGTSFAGCVLQDTVQTLAFLQ